MASLEMDAPFVRFAEKVGYQWQLAGFLAIWRSGNVVPTVPDVVSHCLNEDGS